MVDFLIWFYPWTKSLHIISVITWMTGILILHWLFSIHADWIRQGSIADRVFQEFERKFLRYVMNIVMTTTWVFGLMLVFTPGIVDWGEVWPWIKAVGVNVITWYHHWLALRRKDFLRAGNIVPGARYRRVGVISAFTMVLIVVSVVVKY